MREYAEGPSKITSMMKYNIDANHNIIAKSNQRPAQEKPSRSKTLTIESDNALSQEKTLKPNSRRGLKKYIFVMIDIMGY